MRRKVGCDGINGKTGQENPVFCPRDAKHAYIIPRYEFRAFKNFTRIMIR